VVPAAPVWDDPYINEELIAAAAASGELYAPPEPPPVPQRAWEEASEDAVEWVSLVRIDAGTAEDAVAGQPEPRLAPAGNDAVGTSPLASGWVPTLELRQDDLASEVEATDDAVGEQDPESEASGPVSVPIPVDEGLVIIESPLREESPRESHGDRASEADERGAEPELLDGARGVASTPRTWHERQAPNERSARDETRRRDGPSRAARTDKSPAGWTPDRYFSRGSAVTWGAGLEVAGTNDDALYLTQRAGSGPGEEQGFIYTIPVHGSGPYLVRLYFVEPSWGVSEDPPGADGQRVFSVIGEGVIVLADLDIFAEAGSLTALVKQVPLDVRDGELTLQFTASEGEPLVAAIEILAPASG
jgi:hypothetical protein